MQKTKRATEHLIRTRAMRLGLCFAVLTGIASSGGASGETSGETAGAGAKNPIVPIVVDDYVLAAGHASLADWKIAEKPRHPKNNQPTAERIELGRTLFFETALSANNDRSCATCHNPAQVWADGQPTALDLQQQPMGRATPSLINVGYAEPIMWDGRSPNLEHQAMLPILSESEMGGQVEVVLARLQASATYVEKFEAAYAVNTITSEYVSRAIAAFERTITSTTTDFDRWVAGDAQSMSAAAVRGFAVFVDADKGRCAVCHAPPLFTDHSFHNVGLPAAETPDLGRFAEIPLASMRGAFRTPQLREIKATAPYFHDGSSTTLTEVVGHYVDGFEATPDLSKEMQRLTLSEQEQADLVVFLGSLKTSPNFSVSSTAHVHVDGSSANQVVSVGNTISSEVK